MSKNRHGAAKKLAYNRPSRGYQVNQAKKLIKESDLPKRKDTKKLLRNLKILLAVWVVATAVDTYIEGLSGFVGMLLLGVIIAAAVLAYVKKLDKDVIRGYKSLGLSKEEYLGEAARLGVTGKRMKILDKMWDKTKVKKKKPDPEKK